VAAQSEDQQILAWRRSSRCSPAGDNCVEIRHRVDAVDIRDSKAGFLSITVSAAAWRNFVAELP
jgi:hypothetical protein